MNCKSFRLNGVINVTYEIPESIPSLKVEFVIVNEYLKGNIGHSNKSVYKINMFPPLHAKPAFS